MPFFRTLSPELRQRFLDQLKVFVWEKEFIGANGFTITDEVRVVVGATAVQLVLHLGLGYYDRLREIIVYPGSFKLPDRTGRGAGGGEALGAGHPLMAGGARGAEQPEDGHDTAAHEFAHALDRGGRGLRWDPEAAEYSHYRAWASVMDEHYQALRQGRRAERRVMDDYGALNEAEFFAVATESFFEKPRQMKERTPDLYEELKRFYGWGSGGRGVSRNWQDGQSGAAEGSTLPGLSWFT